jgi:hypothetical protein
MKNIFEFVTERNICDGKENVRDGEGRHIRIVITQHIHETLNDAVVIYNPVQLFLTIEH